MNLFFSDEKMIEFENLLDFNAEIVYLEEVYSQKKSVQLLTTILTLSWYYAIEGNVNQNPANYDQLFFLSKWREYIAIGIKDYFGSFEFCLLAGYTLSLHGFYLLGHMDAVGQALISKSKTLATKEEERLLSSFFENRKGFKEKEKLLQLKEKLFSGEVLINRYFNEIIY
ncbi:hypothetical protein FACS1894211_02890 [Clostridia bacterium]|nr:hypothetical protein FACS1894211_02890 [Clostridia bacterium]